MIVFSSIETGIITKDCLVLDNRQYPKIASLGHFKTVNFNLLDDHDNKVFVGAIENSLEKLNKWAAN